MGRAQKENAEKTFLLAGERQRAAAGRSVWFRSGISDKMSSSGVVKTHKGTKSRLRGILCLCAERGLILFERSERQNPLCLPKKRGVVQFKIMKVGKVTHYYNKAEVAIIELEGDLKVGDTVRFTGHGADFEQVVESMQVNHEQVESAKKGDVIGMKVAQEVKEGTEVVKD